MIKPPIPPDEPARLAALHQLAVLDTPPDPRLDELVEFASRQLHMPIALVTLVDGQRQWFKARTGLELQETPRDIAFCAHAINSDETLVVEDAAQDPRFADNPLVTGPPQLRFYAGAPLLSPQGHRLGTFCVMDHQPRHLDSRDLTTLRSLGHVAAWELMHQAH